MRTLITATATLLAACWLLSPGLAAAHNNALGDGWNRPPRWSFEQDGQHGFEISLLGTIRPTAAGGAVIFGFPIAPRGFSPLINDAMFLDLEFQTDAWPRRNVASAVRLGVRYQLFLFDWFAPYAFTRVGARGTWPGFKLDDGPHPGLALAGGLGAVFIVGKHFGFRLEGGYPGAWAGFHFMF